MPAPTTYRALVAEEVNGRFIQTVKTLPVSNLPQHDVLVRVHYSSLNYKDALSATGHKGVTKSYPFTPGIDAAGVVEESSDSRFEAGLKVIVTSYDLGMNTPGGFGQYIRVPGSWIIPLPGGLSLQESMMNGTSGLTAALGVDKIRHQNISPEDGRVLVTGATGAVGSFAVALLSHLGYRVTAASGKTEQKQFLSELGASDVIHRDEVTGIPDKPLAPGRWIAAVDTVGGSMLDAVLRQTLPNGVVACCGNILGHKLSTSIYPFILRGISLSGIDSGNCGIKTRLRIWKRLASQWKPETLPLLSRVIPFEELQEEIESMLAGRQTGKVVVRLRE